MLLAIPILRGFAVFLSDTVHFESVHGRKCKYQVLCMSLYLPSKVCVVIVATEVLFFGTLIKIHPNKWETVVEEQITSTSELCYSVWKIRNTSHYIFL